MKCFKAVYLASATTTHSFPSGTFISWSFWEHPPISYTVGTKTLRPEGCGPLAAFESLMEAEEFVSRCTTIPSSCAILEGEGELAGEKKMDKPWKGLWWKDVIILDLDCVPGNTMFLESFTPEKAHPCGQAE